MEYGRTIVEVDGDRNHGGIGLSLGSVGTEVDLSVTLRLGLRIEGFDAWNLCGVMVKLV